MVNSFLDGLAHHAPLFFGERFGGIALRDFRQAHDDAPRVGREIPTELVADFLDLLRVGCHDIAVD